MEINFTSTIIDEDTVIGKFSPEFYYDNTTCIIRN
jgi:hypothetical protein